MIKKWRNRFILFIFIAAFLAIMGSYFYINMKQTNDRVLRLKNAEVIVVEMERIDGTDYGSGGSYYWGYDLPPYLSIKHPEKGYDSSTILTYTLEQYERMGHKLEVYCIVEEDGSYVSLDKEYVDDYIPFDYFESIFLWVLAGLSFGFALFFVVKNIIFFVISAKGEQSIGHFEEAFHTKFGSSKYYKVKYTFLKDNENVTAVSPPIYDGRDVDKLKNYGTFIVKYKGNKSVIDQKL